MRDDKNQNWPKITVRLAERADAVAIFELVVELARSRDAMTKVVSSVDDIARDGFGGDPAFEALIAEIDNRAVGLCLFFGSYSTWRGQRGIYVQDLIVADDTRSFGIGRLLLAATTALCQARGAGYLRLSVDDDNSRARSFYQRCGLQHSKSEQIYLIEDDDLAELAGSVERVEA